MTLEEDREEEISGAQFLCETVMRSLTLEEAPDHRPLRRTQHASHRPQGERRPLPRGAASLCPLRDSLTPSVLLYRPPVVSRGPSCCPEPANAEAAPDEEEVCAARLESAAVTQSPGQRREEDGKPGAYCCPLFPAASERFGDWSSYCSWRSFPGAGEGKSAG